MFSPGRLLQELSSLPPARRHWVAYSGGCDSHVLLHALARLRPSLADVPVAAAHVDHGLRPASKSWRAHCERVCAELDIPLRCFTVDARAAPGQSPEAAARAARYAALATLIEEGDCLLTAHHQDDQAETLLLQLLRGGGPHGLAAMPAHTAFAAGTLARPLLAFTREALREYARAHALMWIDDPSNSDTEFDRNFLRHEILPSVRTRWPAAARTLARAARHQAEAAALLDRMAREDAARAAGARADTLSVRALSQLDPPRQRNALRYWIKSLRLPPPDGEHLARIQREALACADGRMPRVHWPGAEVRRYRDALYAMPPLIPHDITARIEWDMRASLYLPGGRLEAVEAAGQGINMGLCRGRSVSVRFRHGGEHCRLAGRGVTHTLKHLFQEWGVPPWERARVPLIYLDDQLAAVAGYGVCSPFAALENEAGWVFEYTENLPAARHGE